MLTKQKIITKSDDYMVIIDPSLGILRIRRKISV